MEDVGELFAAWERERPDLDVSTMVTVGRVLRFAAQARAAIAENAKVYGVSIEEGDILFTLRRAGSPYLASPTAIAAALLVPSGTLTGRLDNLERLGAIERVPDPSDRRAMSVRLTAQGVAATGMAITAHVALEQQLLAPLSERERAQLDRLMTKLLAPAGS